MFIHEKRAQSPSLRRGSVKFSYSLKRQDLKRYLNRDISILRMLHVFLHFKAIDAMIAKPKTVSKLNFKKYSKLEPILV